MAKRTSSVKIPTTTTTTEGSTRTYQLSQVPGGWLALAQEQGQVAVLGRFASRTNARLAVEQDKTEQAPFETLAPVPVEEPTPAPEPTTPTEEPVPEPVEEHTPEEPQEPQPERKGRSVPQYEARGRAGLVAYERSRTTGHYVSILFACQAQLSNEGGEWITCCEEHGTLANHRTQSLARTHLPTGDWCEACQAEIAARPPREERAPRSASGSTRRRLLYSVRLTSEEFDMLSQWRAALHADWTLDAAVEFATRTGLAALVQHDELADAIDATEGDEEVHA
jgi:hypothetical protein